RLANHFTPNMQIARYTMPMTILALDIGKVRTGIAVSDSSETVASPLRVIPTAQLLGGSAEFRRLVSDYHNIRLLVGLPISLDGEEHAQASWVRDVAATIAQTYNLELFFYDERRSTSQATEMMREMGYNARTMRDKIDMVAAGVFLQSYLDSLRNEGRQ
ncbi:MAG: Holliday junction resolvase RuvX, partial [Coriobacteriia bacterium]|nr:Holliday junction resolvase RuvX [Coriobacteriia bacterium]